MIPWWMTGKDNISFNHALSCGSMMMLGTYNFAMLRMIFGCEPEACLDCDTTVWKDGVHDKCDYDFNARFRFPGGAIGEAMTTMRGPTLWKPSEARVTTRAVVVEDGHLPATQEKLRTRQITLHGFLHAVVWHRIDIKDSFEIRDRESTEVVKKWVETSSRKAYTYKAAGGEFVGCKGEDWWMSYRYQMEEFVNRVKGRKTQHWIDADDSVKQMQMVDMAYEKSGLGVRPTNDFR
ncbi:hypothetical protein VTL71DRAFT_1882 [Oculimacula yallundae]|uniref:Gfo/Idh/MocA-like oxidoreductase C-terminal domain-containing protein n=1 Tax=Oculimacula yallundae TaxID=86028 RepID=A0ABR4CD57_9HELO